MKVYTPKEIIHLSEAIHRNEVSYQWLLQNNCRELAALSDYLVYGNYHAKRWLRRNKYEMIRIFIKAWEDDTSSSFDFLMKNNLKEWAATINASNDNEKANQWLIGSNYRHFSLLAKAINSIPERTDEIYFDEDDEDMPFMRTVLGFFFKKYRSSGEKW